MGGGRRFSRTAGWCYPPAMATISVTRLRVRSWWYFPSFVVQANRAAQQAAAAPGNLAVRLLRDRKNTYWTLTAWSDDAAMKTFMHAGTHGAVMRKLLDWCDEAALVHWTQDSANLPHVGGGAPATAAGWTPLEGPSPLGCARGVRDSGSRYRRYARQKTEIDARGRSFRRVPVMYVLLFNLAGPAILAWALMIFLPTWSVTRWVATRAVFPAYLAALYVIGVVPLVIAAGPGIMLDFGTADGVLRLLADPSVALIAWIHILTFDQVAGILIYRHNMRHRVMPLPVQSVILFLTLMFGPAGFLAYYAACAVKKQGSVFAD